MTLILPQIIQPTKCSKKLNFVANGLNVYLTRKSYDFSMIQLFTVSNFNARLALCALNGPESPEIFRGSVSLLTSLVFTTPSPPFHLIINPPTPATCISVVWWCGVQEEGGISGSPSLTMHTTLWILMYQSVDMVMFTIGTCAEWKKWDSLFVLCIRFGDRLCVAKSFRVTIINIFDE